MAGGVSLPEKKEMAMEYLRQPARESPRSCGNMSAWLQVQELEVNA
jgi:hypothetical protein